MRRLVNYAIGLALISIVATAGSTAFATAPDEGQYGLGVFVGMYQPAGDIFDDSTVVGLRFGAMLTEHVAVSASLGFVGLESDDDEMEDLGLTGDIDADLTLLDINAWYIFTPQKRLSFTVGGGIGGSFASVDADVTLSGGGKLKAEDVEGDSLTVNVGFGPIIGLGERTYLRLLPQFRYYENREDDEIDFQTSLMFGWTLGG
jgi:hypothetical protein